MKDAIQSELKLSVVIQIEAFWDDLDARSVAQSITGSVQLANPFRSRGDNGFVEPIEIGSISAVRPMTTHFTSFLRWSDLLYGPLEFALEWLMANENVDDLMMEEGLIYLDSVEISPKWQRQGHGSKAVATFLSLIGATAVIAVPDRDQKAEWVKFCDSCGIKHYDPAANILWQYPWQHPYKFRGVSDTEVIR